MHILRDVVNKLVTNAVVEPTFNTDRAVIYSNKTVN